MNPEACPCVCTVRGRWTGVLLCALLLTTTVAAQEKSFETVFEVWSKDELIGRETAVYTVDEKKQTALLSSECRLDLSGEKLELRGEVKLQLPGPSVTGYQLIRLAGTKVAQMTLDRQDGHFLLTSSTAVSSRPRQVEARPDTVVLDTNVPAHYQLLAWRWDPRSEELTCPVVIPQLGLTLKAEATARGQRLAELAGKPVFARRLHLTVGSTVADLWVADPTRELLQVTFPATRTEYRRPDVSWLSEERPHRPR